MKKRTGKRDGEEGGRLVGRRDGEEGGQETRNVLLSSQQ